VQNGVILLKRPPSIRAYAAVVGKKEGEGPLGDWFDQVHADTTFGQKTWEQAESRMQQMAVQTVLKKADLSAADIDLLFAGDLLNQCIGSSFGLQSFELPYYGLYGACSTMAESISLASLAVQAGYAHRALAVTSSHFCSAERQYRMPLEYGGQRAPSAQWTVTGSGAVILQSTGKAPYVRAVCAGRITDLGVCDINNMGAAMAPAAYRTIRTFLEETHTSPNDYDRIFTGDLGQIGTSILYELFDQDGMDLRAVHDDCGLMIYNLKEQDVHAGGSGCGCSASVLCGVILPQFAAGKYHNVLFVATGALMSPTSYQQGSSIPGIAHLVYLSDQDTPFHRQEEIS
jgi:stage V sporulation protein AD